MSINNLRYWNLCLDITQMPPSVIYVRYLFFCTCIILVTPICNLHIGLNHVANNRVVALLVVHKQNLNKFRNVIHHESNKTEKIFSNINA